MTMAWEQFDPQRFLGTFRREIDKVFEDVFSGRATHHPHRHRRAETGDIMEPAVDVIETAEAIVVKAQVPGVLRENLSLEVSPEAMTLQGENKAGEGGEGRYHLQEICYGAFARTISFPVRVEGDKATAVLKEGVLQVTMPKSPQVKGKPVKIEVQ
jgi:HSP20 family protein